MTPSIDVGQLPVSINVSPTINTISVTNRNQVVEVVTGTPTLSFTNNGLQGPAGAKGADGAKGDSGVGVPIGGTSGQILAKNSNTAYDTHWIDAPTGGTGIGSGDVVGPASAVNNNLVAFDTTTGKLIKDSGSSISSFATAGHTHTGTYDPSGAASSAVSIHVGLTDPHAQYALESTLGTAAYTASIAYAPSGHNHSGTYLPVNNPSTTGTMLISTNTLDGTDAILQVNGKISSIKGLATPHISVTTEGTLGYISADSYLYLVTPYIWSSATTIDFAAATVCNIGGNVGFSGAANFGATKYATAGNPLTTSSQLSLYTYGWGGTTGYEYQSAWSMYTVQTDYTNFKSTFMLVQSGIGTRFQISDTGKVIIPDLDTSGIVTNTSGGQLGTSALKTVNGTSLLGSGNISVGSGTPATTVQNANAYGITAAIGTSTNYAREDHTHGTPSLPTPGDIGAATSGHTHTQLHDRLHTVTDTSDHTFPGGTTTYLRADGTFASLPASGDGGLSFKYAFNTATTSNPSAGNIQYNNATPASATIIYLNETDGSGITIDPYLDKMRAGDSIMLSNSDKSKYHVFTLTANFTSGAGIDTIPVAYSFGTGTFTNAETIFVSVSIIDAASITRAAYTTASTATLSNFTGTVNTAATMQVINNIPSIFTESATAAAHTADVAFTGMSTVYKPNYLVVRARYLNAGSAHAVTIQARDYSGGGYSGTLATLNNQTGQFEYLVIPLDATQRVNFTDSSGNGIIRFNHASNGTAGHILEVDYAAFVFNPMADEPTADPMAPGRLLHVQTLTATANSPYTPTSGTAFVRIAGVAGGGAGGGAATSSTQVSVGGGGASGGTFEHWFPVVSGQTCAYAIGAAGTAGSAGAAGNAGGDTTFTVPATDIAASVTITAKGGGGGPVLAAGTTVLMVAGGTAGAATVNANMNGQGSTGGIGIRGSSTVGTSGQGASSPYGGGGIGRSTLGVGTAGSGNGAGGGGSMTTSTSQVGAVGTIGIIYVYEYT